MRSDLFGSAPEAFWSPFGPLSTGHGFWAVRSSTDDRQQERRGDQRGTTENDPGHDEAQAKPTLTWAFTSG